MCRSVTEPLTALFHFIKQYRCASNILVAQLHIELMQRNANIHIRFPTDFQQVMLGSKCSLLILGLPELARTTKLYKIVPFSFGMAKAFDKSNDKHCAVAVWPREKYKSLTKTMSRKKAHFLLK